MCRDLKRFAFDSLDPFLAAELILVSNTDKLLTNRAPTDSLYDGLRPDLRYLTADSLTGEVGQFLSAISLLHLGQETQRISIIPSIWKDNDHYGKSQVRMSDLFDMERFRRDVSSRFCFQLERIELRDCELYRQGHYSSNGATSKCSILRGWAKRTRLAGEHIAAFD